jgi:hypothetical protein
MFLPVLSPRSFIVLCFTFSSMIHFELIFVKGIRSVTGFMFSPVNFDMNILSRKNKWRDLQRHFIISFSMV